jgi:hypothetical protein
VTGLTGVSPNSSARYRFTGRPSTVSTSSSLNAEAAGWPATASTISQGKKVMGRHLAGNIDFEKRLTRLSHH